MSVGGLGLLFLEVNNLQESLDFYVGGLGFELVSSDSRAEPPMATLRAGSLRVMLAQQPLAMARRGRGVHFFFTAADVDLYHAQLRARGIETAPPADEGWGGRFVTLEDPDRYRLFFVTWDNA
ncbi:MAG TPA: VOC family protein [Pyrinomonadaceae bacterium]|nr:VOC family protein [Pyrinomonadaceae bacterium]